MSNTTISPNMGLPVPVVGTDPGPDWANNINACLSVIDQHNHTSGQGVPIPSAGLNINSDLPFNNNNGISYRSVRFFSQGAPIPASSPDLDASMSAAPIFTTTMRTATKSASHRAGRSPDRQARSQGCHRARHRRPIRPACSRSRGRRARRRLWLLVP